MKRKSRERAITHDDRLSGKLDIGKFVRLWDVTASLFLITLGAAARIWIHTSPEPKKTCRLPALKINNPTRNRLKIETANSQRALAAAEGITKLKCHISVKQKATSALGEMIHSPCSCFPFVTG